jgi:rRNA maturation RNase YbeY
MIQFTDQDAGFKLKQISNHKSWIKAAIGKESHKAGDISYIFCTDKFLSEINLKYLKHNTLTDIITFDYSEKGILSGDIFISVERVNENARNFGKTFEEELRRVMIHGILHLAGYNDKSNEEKEMMRVREDHYLASWNETGKR